MQDTANVSIRELGGNLVFYDQSGNEILTIDGANRRLSFPPASGLVTPEHIDASDLADESVTLAKLAEDVTALTDIIAAIPTVDAEDSETIWNDAGVLKVSSAGV